MKPPCRYCFLLPAAAMLVTATAAAADQESFDAGVAWRGNVVRDAGDRFESCAVMRAYDDDSVLSFALTREHDFFMIVSNPRIRMPPGAAFSVRYTIDNGIVYQAPAEALRQSVVVDLPDNAALREMLGNGGWLFLNELGDVGYSLQGAGLGLRALADCVERTLTAERMPPADATTARPGPATAVPQAAAGAAAELDTYDSEALARTDWQHMTKVMGSLFDGREPQFVTRTRSRDGRAFTVLRVAGFTDRDAATRFCTALKAKKRDCTVK